MGSLFRHDAAKATVPNDTGETRMFYPMYLMTFPTVMGLTHMSPHQVLLHARADLHRAVRGIPCLNLPLFAACYCSAAQWSGIASQFPGGVNANGPSFGYLPLDVALSVNEDNNELWRAMVSSGADVNAKSFVVGDGTILNGAHFVRHGGRAPQPAPRARARHARLPLRLLLGLHAAALRGGARVH